MAMDPNIFKVLRRHMRSAPVDVEGAINELGIRVSRAWLDPGISGQIERRADGSYQIAVNESDVSTRQRFTMAHELGHYIYHRDLIGTGIDDDRAYRSTAVGAYHNTAIGPLQEAEANRFAANFLMPRDLIASLEADGVTTIPDLARALGVSIPAMRVRRGLPPYPTAEEEFSPLVDGVA